MQWFDCSPHAVYETHGTDQHLSISSIPSASANHCAVLWFYEFDLKKSRIRDTIQYLSFTAWLTSFSSNSVVSRILCLFSFSFSCSFPAPVPVFRCIENETLILFTKILHKNVTVIRKLDILENTFTLWHIFDSSWGKVARLDAECFPLLPLMSVALRHTDFT